VVIVEFAPIWDSATELIHSEHPTIQLLQFNCKASPEAGRLCKQFGIKGYPTVKYVRPSLSDEELLSLSRDDPTQLLTIPRFVYDFTGSRSIADLVKFVTIRSVWKSSEETAYPLPPEAVPIHIPVKPVDWTMMTVLGIGGLLLLVLYQLKARLQPLISRQPPKSTTPQLSSSDLRSKRLTKLTSEQNHTPAVPHHRNTVASQRQSQAKIDSLKWLSDST